MVVSTLLLRRHLGAIDPVSRIVSHVLCTGPCSLRVLHDRDWGGCGADGRVRIGARFHRMVDNRVTHIEGGVRNAERNGAASGASGGHYGARGNGDHGAAFDLGQDLTSRGTARFVGHDRRRRLTGLVTGSGWQVFAGDTVVVIIQAVRMGGIGIEFRLGLLLKGEIGAAAALPLLSGEWFFLPPPLASGEAVLPLGRCGRSSQAIPSLSSSRPFGSERKALRFA
jgi:hypothetical protein